MLGDEDGICVQRLFSNFADGWPGAGLLLQRLLTGGALIYCAVTCVTSTPICFTVLAESIGALLGLLLMAGLWTPIAGLFIAILEPSHSLPVAGERRTFHFDRCARSNASDDRTGQLVAGCVGLRTEAN